MNNPKFVDSKGIDIDFNQPIDLDLDDVKWSHVPSLVPKMVEVIQHINFEITSLLEMLNEKQLNMAHFHQRLFVLTNLGKSILAEIKDPDSSISLY